MTVEITVSRRDGHVTFAVSDRTCWRKVNGLVVFDAICRSAFTDPESRALDAPVGRECLPGFGLRESAQYSAHAFRARKAGSPARRAACLLRLHKTDSRHMQVPKTRLTCRTRFAEPFNRPAMHSSDNAVGPRRWQGQQGSNPRPAVLETAALPTELYPYRGCFISQ